jgi:hypothetical protein
MPLVAPRPLLVVNGAADRRCGLFAWRWRVLVVIVRLCTGGMNAHDCSYSNPSVRLSSFVSRPASSPTSVTAAAVVR